LVSGILAVILSANPNLTLAEVRWVLKESAVKSGLEGWSFDSNGHSLAFGYGRIDAGAAVDLVDGAGSFPIAWQAHNARILPDLGKESATGIYFINKGRKIYLQSVEKNTIGIKNRALVRRVENGISAEYRLGNRRLWIDDRLTLGLSEKLNQTDRVALFDELGLTKVKRLPANSYLVSTAASPDNTIVISREVLEHPLVRYCEPDVSRFMQKR